MAGAYLDQLERSNGLAAARVTAVRQQLRNAERAKGQGRRDALNQLAAQLGQDAAGAADAAKVRTLAAAVTNLANAEP